MEKEQRVVLLAEEVQIDEKRSNDIFLLISFKLFDNKGNQNGQGATAKFISEIINNADKYVALPLYADVSKQLAKDYAHLTHLFNPLTGKFDTTQIGGIVDFRTEIDNDGVVSLYGTARVPKRETEVCERLAELYDLGMQSVSFEIKYNPQDTIIKDGVQFVDAGEDNSLTGMCVVSVPACPDANALDMVAEATKTAETNEVKETMTEENKNEVMEAEEAVETAEAEVENENAEAPEAIAEAESAPATAESAEAEVVHESVNVHESVDQCEYDGKTYHTVSTEHVIVETVEPEAPAPAAVIAEEDDKDRKITELKARIAELEGMEAELKEIKEAQAKAEHEAKIEKVKAFASKQGLDVEDEAVKSAIAELNYEAIADMAEKKNEKENEKKPEITMATFVEMETTGKYGGLLERR